MITEQDLVLHRDQALANRLTAGAIKHRLRTKQWQILLPDVYLTVPGEPSRRQLLVAALLYAGPGSAIDGPDACRFHGVRAVAIDEQRVHVVLPWGEAARSIGYLVVRRTTKPFEIVSTERLRYLDAAAAVIAATRRMRNGRAALAAVSDAVQRGVATPDQLLVAHLRASSRNASMTETALEPVCAGIRSVPEADARRILDASLVLGHVEYNVWLRLPDGRKVCADSLIRSSAVIHEVNGRSAHARGDLFEDMQERHDALTAAGFTVLHNSPRHIRSRPRELLAQVERCHQMYDGRGIPPGVEILGVGELGAF